jgi:dipeptidase E
MPATRRRPRRGQRSSSRRRRRRGAPTRLADERDAGAARLCRFAQIGVQVAPTRKRRLVLYSGGQERRNGQIHESLLDLALRRQAPHRRRGVHMTYIPYTEEGAKPFYQRFVRRYRSFGAASFECVAPDRPELLTDRRARRRAERAIVDSDIVYLSGGNTFHFLYHLRRSGLLDALTHFAARGRIVAGLSAGGILMTPHIGLAGYPPFDRDENAVELSKRQERALNLVDFEFFPHYRQSTRYREALRSYSRRTGTPLYACRDGSGIVIEGDCFTAHGEVWLFDRGQVLKISG